LTDSLDSEFSALAHQLADVAGAAAMAVFRTGFDIETKDDASPVTHADREAEAVMRERINATFPDHGILGEEHGAERTDAEFVWVLDPIDGTRAFVNGIPLFATLIALVRDGIPVLGLNAFPALNERWLATSDEPTRHWEREHDGVAVRVRACPSLASAQ
ncbi:unnamed protein product, partial [Laminaria digitata]